MRELKFRMWLKSTSKMTHFGLDTNEGIIYIEPEIMQYTGLRDMNGVEIYEGDILKRHSPTQGSGHIFTVAWREGTNGVGFTLSASPTAKATGKLNTLEVIGNVHENADLLERES